MRPPMSLSLFIVSLALVLSLPGCDSGCKCVDPGRYGDIGEIIMFDSIDDISLDKDAAEITEVGFDPGAIRLTVRHSGGCKRHYFKLYGSSSFAKSDPPQAEIYLSHNGNGDMCEAIVGGALVFDLGPLEEAYIQAFGSGGAVLLRIHEPGAADPIEPLPLYIF
jgi:hypothetical protein